MAGLFIPGQRITPTHAKVLPDGWARPDRRWDAVVLFKALGGTSQYMFDMAHGASRFRRRYINVPYAGPRTYTYEAFRSKSLKPSSMGMAAGLPYANGSGGQETPVYKVAFSASEYTVVTVYHLEFPYAASTYYGTLFSWSETSGPSIGLNLWIDYLFPTISPDTTKTNGVLHSGLFGYTSPGMVTVARYVAGQLVELFTGKIGSSAKKKYVTAVTAQAVDFTASSTRTQNFRIGYGTGSSDSYAIPGGVAAVGVLGRAISDGEADEIIRNPACLFEPEYEYLASLTGGFSGTTLVGSNSFHPHTAGTGAVTFTYDGGSFSITSSSTLAFNSESLVEAVFSANTYTRPIVLSNAIYYVSAEFVLNTLTYPSIPGHATQSSGFSVETLTDIEAKAAAYQNVNFTVETNSQPAIRGEGMAEAPFSIAADSLDDFKASALAIGAFFSGSGSSLVFPGQCVENAATAIQTKTELAFLTPALPIVDGIPVMLAMAEATVSLRQNSLVVRIPND